MIARLGSKYSNLRSYLFKPISSAPLGLFRILWGCVMTYHFYKLAFISGEILYKDTIFHFKYPFFEWIKAVPSDYLFLCFYLGIIVSILTTLGLYYKKAIKILFIVYTYVFLQDVSYWNNHYYAYMLINGFFVISDAHSSFSVDKRRLNLPSNIPQWQLVLFQFQIMLIYFYGGLSKLQNKDWMENVTGYALVLNNIKIHKIYLYPISLLITYGGLIYDLVIPFFLKWRKTIYMCIPFILFFNISNIFLFNIGTFPYSMIASIVLFIPSYHILKFLKIKTVDQIKLNTPNSLVKNTITTLFVCFILFQILFPFRSLFIKGNVFWTGEAKLYSWHMMSGSNRINANSFFIEEFDDDGTLIKQTAVDASKYLNYKQLKAMATFPMLVPQFARFLKEESELAGFKNVKIYGEVFLSKNYRSPKTIIDPNIELSSLNASYYSHNPWIILYDTEKGYFK